MKLLICRRWRAQSCWLWWLLSRWPSWWNCLAMHSSVCNDAYGLTLASPGWEVSSFIEMSHQAKWWFVKESWRREWATLSSDLIHQNIGSFLKFKIEPKGNIFLGGWSAQMVKLLRLQGHIQTMTPWKGTPQIRSWSLSLLCDFISSSTIIYSKFCVALESVSSLHAHHQCPGSNLITSSLDVSSFVSSYL